MCNPPFNDSIIRYYHHFVNTKNNFICALALMELQNYYVYFAVPPVIISGIPQADYDRQSGKKTAVISRILSALYFEKQQRCFSK